MSIAYCQGVYLSVNPPPLRFFQLYTFPVLGIPTKSDACHEQWIGLLLVLCFHDVYFVFMIMTLWDFGNVVPICLWDIVELLLNLQLFIQWSSV